MTLTAVSGGTKNMQAADYSIRVCPARIATNGYNNPLEKVVVALTANQRVEVDFSSATSDSSHGQDAWAVFGSLYNASAQAAQQGPWYLLSRGKTRKTCSGSTHAELWILPAVRLRWLARARFSG